MFIQFCERFGLMQKYHGNDKTLFSLYVVVQWLVGHSLNVIIVLALSCLE